MFTSIEYLKNQITPLQKLRIQTLFNINLKSVQSIFFEPKKLTVVFKYAFNLEDMNKIDEILEES